MIKYPSNVLWKTGNSFSAFFEEIFRKNELLRENEELKKENILLINKNLELSEIKKENEQLKKLLSLNNTDNSGYKFEPARIIFSLINDDCFLVNKGKNDGVKNNDPVVIDGKVLVGKIEKTFPNYSEMCLITKKGFKLPVVLLNKKIPLIAEGEGGDKLRINLLPAEEKMKKGDVIVTSNLGRIFPANLLVSKIYNYSRNGSKYFSSVESLAFYEKIWLNEVFVIKDLKNE